MKSKRGPRVLAIFILFAFISQWQTVQGIAVMSVDLGSEWMKIGIVSPGVPMEIVLNKEFKRKTPVAVSFRDNERLFGEDALNVAVRFPSNAYLYFLDLLGKKIDNPIVQLYQKRFPYYNLVADDERGTVLFQHDSETQYSPEELIGMVLSQARQYAEEFAGQPVKDAVITVPPFFNQAERRAMLHAAELADIKVLQLMNANTASALNYGIFRRKDFNGTPQHLLLYDMGSSSTVATVISYQIAKKTKEKANAQLIVSILGVGYDRTLGGLEMQLRLRDHLGKAFNDMKKTKTDVFTNHRALAKLFKEAGRLKNVLSANSDHYAQVEGLLDEKDFNVSVSREQFENLCRDLFDRVKAPVEQALNTAGMSIDLIDQVILVGAGTRVPQVQKKLTELIKRELGKSLNTDEAAAMGAGYKGADLNGGFKVKKFITKDAVLFPILVDFERELEGEDGSGKPIKILRQTLFSQMNPYPQKKILTFTNHVDDFSFYVSHGKGDPLVASHQSLTIGSGSDQLYITKVYIRGVRTALSNNTGDGIEAKGVKAHFVLDGDGIFSLTRVESVFEKNSVAVPPPTAAAFLYKLGSALEFFFGKLKLPGVIISSGDVAESNKPRLVIIKESVDVETVNLDIVPLGGEKLKTFAQKLKHLAEIDKSKALRVEASNALESYVSDMRRKSTSSEFEHFLTEQEKEKIGTFCSETSDWLYEDGFKSEKQIYDEKLKELKLMTKDFLDRAREYMERTDAMTALEQMLNSSTTFLEGWKKLPEDLQYFTQVELSTLEKALKETLDWQQKIMTVQGSLPLSQAPVLTIRNISEKIDALDREVKYLMNKDPPAKILRKQEAATAQKKAKAEGSVNFYSHFIFKSVVIFFVINLN